MPTNSELSPHERGLIDALVATMARGRREAKLQLANAWQVEPEPGSDEHWLSIGTPPGTPLVPEEVGDPTLSVYSNVRYVGELRLIRSEGRFVELDFGGPEGEPPGVPPIFPRLDQLVDEPSPPPLVRAAFENDT